MYSREPTQGKEGNAMFSIACLFAVQFVSFLEGRGIGAVPFPFPGIIVGIFCGLLCGGLLFSTRLREAIRVLVAPEPHRSKRPPVGKRAPK